MKTRSTLALAAILTLLALPLFAGETPRPASPPVETIATNPFVVAMLTAAILIGAGSVLTLPLAIYSGYVVPHQYGLSTQWFTDWLREWLIGRATEIALLSPLVALSLSAIRNFPRRWWLVVWAVSIPIALVVIAPVVLDPLYNDFKPLRDESLRVELLQMAGAAGIEDGRVFQVDKSKQTTTMNAYVAGLGPTKRIALWDTLLQKMSRDEILVVVAHEMAHYTRHHIWKGLAFGYAVMLPCLALGAWFVGVGVRGWGSRWGAASAADPAAIPWLFAVAIGGMILLTPLFAAYSRTIEHEADVIALDRTGLREEAATAFVKFSTDSKWLPQPPKFIEYWFYSHPPLAKRVAFALGAQPVRRTPSVALQPDADPVIARVGKAILRQSDIRCTSTAVAANPATCRKYQAREVREFIQDQMIEACVREFGLDEARIAQAEERGSSSIPDMEAILGQSERLAHAASQVIDGASIDEVYARESSGLYFTKDVLADVVRLLPDAEAVRMSLGREAVRKGLMDTWRKSHRQMEISNQMADRFNEAVWVEHKDADSLEAIAVETLVVKLNVVVAPPFSMPPSKDLLTR